MKKFQAAFLDAEPLALSDILHTDSEAETFKKCLIATILRIMTQHGGEGFKRFEKDLEKYQPVTNDKIALHRTELHPLPTWDIDESTIIGNAEVDQAIVDELQLDEIPEAQDRVRFQGGDQLSLARLRALEIIRAGQMDGYHGFFWGAWIPGLFHGKIADTLGTLMTHWGKPDTGARNPGSLWFHNTCLDRLPIILTSLPSFRVCRDLIFVSLYARILHCSLLVSENSSLEQYTSKTEKWETLVLHAEQIYERFVDVSLVEDLRWRRKMEQMETSLGTDSGVSRPLDDTTPSPPKTVKEGDMVFENAVLFLRDALISREFTNAIKAGDSGRVILVLKIWALSFRGNGRTKYAHEMLHFIHHITKIWGGEITSVDSRIIFCI